MDKVICKCNDKLTPHLYCTSKDTGEEGYLCLVCDDFKPFDSNGDFDAMEHYNKVVN